VQKEELLDLKSAALLLLLIVQERNICQHGGEKKCIESVNWKGVRIYPLGRPGRVWEDNIKLDSKEM
jgi:hypothetical protein